MTATIIPFPQVRRKALEQQAKKIVALIGPGGIDDLVYETSLGWVDTAPSEMNPDEPA